MCENVKPITPDEVFQKFPDWVIEGTNNCIKKYWVDQKKSSNFTQNQLIDEIWKVYEETDGVFDYDIWRKMVFSEHYLDVEEIYRNVGWIVMYNKPGYCESYEPTFMFKKKD